MHSDLPTIPRSDVYNLLADAALADLFPMDRIGFAEWRDGQR